MDKSDLRSQGPLYPRDKTLHPKALTPDYKPSLLRSPKRALVPVNTTMSEISGPVFGPNILGEFDSDLTKNYCSGEQMAIGEQIIVHGKVFDENSKTIPNVLIEVWQANAGGRYRHFSDGYKAPLDPYFGGCGRCVTDQNGYYSFKTIRPGAYPWPNGGNNWRPSHIHFSIFGTSFAQRLITQMYFEGDPLIKLCPIANTIEDPASLNTLVAQLDMKKTIHMDARAYQFNIILRGRFSTIFENKLDGN